jgi:hypothetical protein
MASADVMRASQHSPTRHLADNIVQNVNTYNIARSKLQNAYNRQNDVSVNETVRSAATHINNLINELQNQLRQLQHGCNHQYSMMEVNNVVAERCCNCLLQKSIL